MISLADLPRGISSVALLAAAFALPLSYGCDGGSQPPKQQDKPSQGKPLPAEDGGVGKPIGGSAGEGGTPAAEARTPMIATDHALYGRMEADGVNNTCAADGDCFVGGCSSEICSADKEMNSTCEVLDAQKPASAACGCVSGACIWYTTDGATLPASASQGGGSPEPGGSGPVVCGDKTCAEGESCIEYFGVAGPRGPRFQSCGIPCGPKRTCPEGKSCVTVADGPGDVCQ